MKRILGLALIVTAAILISMSACNKKPAPTQPIPYDNYQYKVTGTTPVKVDYYDLDGVHTTLVVTPWTYNAQIYTGNQAGLDASITMIYPTDNLGIAVYKNANLVCSKNGTGTIPSTVLYASCYGNY